MSVINIIKRMAVVKNANLFACGDVYLFHILNKSRKKSSQNNSDIESFTKHLLDSWRCGKSDYGMLSFSLIKNWWNSNYI